MRFLRSMAVLFLSASSFASSQAANVRDMTLRLYADFETAAAILKPYAGPTRTAQYSDSEKFRICRLTGNISGELDMYKTTTSGLDLVNSEETLALDNELSEIGKMTREHAFIKSTRWTKA